MMNLQNLAQILIFVLGVFTVYLLALKNPRHQRWGYVVGLLAEPAWIYAAWSAHQWGIIILAVIYSGCYALGIWNHWRS